MSYSITCPACAASFHLVKDERGKKLFCPKCGQRMVITGAGVAKRNEGVAAAVAAPAGRGLPWGWLAALLLVAAAAVGLTLLLMSRDHPQESQPLAAKAANEPVAADAADKLRLPASLDPPAGTQTAPAETERNPSTPPKPPDKKPPFILPLAGVGKSGPLADVKGIQFEGTLFIEEPNFSRKAEIAYTITATVSGKLRAEGRFTSPDMKDIILEVYDGQRHWRRQDGKTTEITDKSFESGNWQRLFLGFMALDSGDIKLTVLGDVPVKGRPAIAVKPSRWFSTDEKVILYFDRDTRRLVKVGEVQSNARPLGQEPGLYYSDYRETEGMSWAAKIDLEEGLAVKLNITITSLRLLREVDETSFHKP
jgi:hypothetical protein